MGLIIPVDPLPIKGTGGIIIDQGLDILPVAGDFDGAPGTAGMIFWGLPVVGATVRIQGAGIDQTKTLTASATPIFYVPPLASFTATFSANGYDSGSVPVTSPGGGLIRPFNLTFERAKIKITFNINRLPVDTAVTITHDAQVLESEGVIPAGKTSLVLEVGANGSYSFFANPLGGYDDKFQTFSVGTSPVSFTLQFGEDTTARNGSIVFYVTRINLGEGGGEFILIW